MTSKKNTLKRANVAKRSLKDKYICSYGLGRMVKYGLPVQSVICNRVLVGGKVRHAQGQRLDRSEVRRKEKVRERKGKGEKSTLFPLFLTPHFKLNLKVSIG